MSCAPARFFSTQGSSKVRTTYLSSLLSCSTKLEVTLHLHAQNFLPVCVVVRQSGTVLLLPLERLIYNVTHLAKGESSTLGLLCVDAQIGLISLQRSEDEAVTHLQVLPKLLLLFYRTLLRPWSQL